LARQTPLSRKTSVTSAQRQRFQQEARTASALDHPNIVSLYDIGSESGADFLVMELVRGKTLDQHLLPED
jgi:serine/threonine protein kinase